MKANLLKTIKISSLFLLTWFCIHVLVICVYGLVDSTKKADVIVVLGNTVNKDSTLSPRLEARLRKGLEIYQNGQAQKIIVSGGTGKEGVNEATEMYLFYQLQGVSSEDIYIDTIGNNTLLTAQHTAELCNRNNFTSVLIVSQYYHLVRCVLLFKQGNIVVSGTASPNFFECRDLYSIPREFVGFYYYLFFKSK